MFYRNFKKWKEKKAILSNIYVKARSWKLEVTTEPPTTGGMTVHTGQKYTVMSAKTMIQKPSRALQEVVLSVAFLSLISDNSYTWTNKTLPEHTEIK